MGRRFLRGKQRTGVMGRVKTRCSFELLENRRLMALVQPGYEESIFKDGLTTNPAALSVDPAAGNVYFAGNGSEGALYRISPDGARTLTTLTTDFTPADPTAAPPTYAPDTDIQFYGGSVYTVINRTGPTMSGNLVRIDTTTGATTIITSPSGLGEHAGVEAVAGKNAIYFTDGNGTANSLFRYDLATGATSLITDRLQFNSYSLQLNPSDGKLYYARAGEGFFRIDESEAAGTGAMVIQISNEPNSIGNFAIDPLGQHIYFRYFGNIKRISLSTNAVENFAIGLSSNGNEDVAFGPSSSGQGFSLYTGDGNRILEYSGFTDTPPQPQPGGIVGTIWQDLDGDGLRAPNEPAQAGVVVFLDADQDGNLDASERQTVTDAEGSYFFSDVTPGQYVVREVLPTDHRQTSPSADRDFYYGWDWQQGSLHRIEAASGNVTTVGNGYFQLHGLAQTNSGELYGINGYNNALYKIDTQNGTTTFVGSAGMQLAFGLAYDAQEDVLYGLAAPPGADPNLGEVLLVRFNRATGGVTPVSGQLTPGVHSTSGMTFDSINRRVLAFDNDPGETFAFDIDSGVGTQLSFMNPRFGIGGISENGAGKLIFAYYDQLISMDPETGATLPYLPLSKPVYLDSLELVNFEENAHRVTVGSGQVVSGFDFGNQSILSSVQGAEWNDLNGNGSREIGEPALADVVVYVDYDNDGHRDNSEPHTTTNPDGSYQIDGLRPGQYVVRQELPANFRQTSPGQLRDFYWGYDAWSDRIVKVDARSGIVTPVGESGSIGVSADMHGLAQTRDGELYAMSGHTNSLYRIDTSSGIATQIRHNNLALAWGMAYDAVTDTIYGLATPWGYPEGSVQLITYDRRTGGVTFIGNQITTGVPRTGAIAFDPVTRRLFAFDNDDRELLAFDVTTGVGTSLVKDLPFYASGMTDDGSGNLAVATPYGIARINTNTLAVTPITGPLNNYFLEALDFVDLEPAGHKLYAGPATQTDGLNFGNQSILGRIQGIKWEDLDGDGQRDASERPLAGLLIYIDANNNGRLDSSEMSTTTDAAGAYEFSNLQPGRHIVREMLPYGYEQTSPGVQRDLYWGYDSNARRIIKVDAASGQVTPIGGQGSIGDVSHIHGLVETTTGQLFGISGSDNAFYSIDPTSGLATRIGYTGAILAWALTYDPISDTIYGAATPRGTRGPDLQLVTFDRTTGAVDYIGNTPARNIENTTGMAFDPVTRSVLLYDLGQNGRLFSFDPHTGSSTLLRSDLQFYAGSMASNGAGQLILPYYNQLVRLNPATGELFALAGMSENVFLEAFEGIDYERFAHIAYLPPAGAVEGLNFGNRSVVSSLSGVKFEDVNGDGERQPSEPPLAGVTLYLDLNQDGQLTSGEPTALTDASGAYVFTDVLPGRYIVREIVPEGYSPSPIQGPLDYLVGYDISTRQIVTIDPGTGTVATLVQMGNFPDLNGLVRTNANEWFGISGQTNTLFKIDPGSGAVTVVGSAGRHVAWGLAYDSVTDKIYGLAHPGSDLGMIALAEYDRLTGEATIIGTPISGVHYTSGLTFDPVSRRVIAFDNSDVRELYAFDPVTGIGELLPVSLSNGSTYGLAADGTGGLIVQAGYGLLARLDPVNGQTSHYLQLTGGVALEGLEFIDFATEGHDVLVAARSHTAQLNFGNRNLAPTNVVFTLDAPAFEAQPAVFSGSFTDPGSFEKHHVLIDWGDGSVQSLELDPGDKDFSASHSFADNRSSGYKVTVTVRDSSGGAATAEKVVAVGNVAPTLSVSGPTTGVRGQSRTFNFTATDPSASDRAGVFSYAINWGDSSPPQILSGSTSLTAEHKFIDSGTFQVQVTATDKDGGTSLVASHAITVGSFAMEETTLVIGGTIGDDSIVIRPSGSAGVGLTINGVSHLNLPVPTHIFVFAQAGGDTIVLDLLKVKKVTTYLSTCVTIDAGAGNDTIDARGSTANNVLLGGADKDTLYGGAGRDILIGGLGADVLRGGGGDDVLIGGATRFDSNLSALASLMAEWGRINLDYAGRVDHLSGASTGGLNGGNFLTSMTVLDDADVDQLYGEGDQDWFLYLATGTWADNLRDRKNNERATRL